MKKAIYIIPMLLCIVILLNSCATNKEALAQRKADIQQSKDDNSSSYVKLNDGTIKHYETLKIITGVFKLPYLLADGKIKINANEIVAYQNKDHYAISQKLFTTGRRSYLALETLPGFAIRIAKGKLNVYVKKFLNGSKAVDEYFLQQGEDGPIYAYTAESMNDLVKDNPDAVNFFYNRKYNTRLPKRQQVNVSYSNNASLVYKHASMITKN